MEKWNLTNPQKNIYNMTQAYKDTTVSIIGGIANLNDINFDLEKWQKTLKNIRKHINE